jgi:hypothetical protein
MIVPNNTIQTGKYTQGGEYRVASTNAPYQGYYYELNGSFFAGKTYQNKAPKLIPESQTNKLLNSKATATYSLISGISSQDLQVPPIKSVQYSSDNIDIKERYFCRQVTIYPILIKEIDKDTYDTVKSNPLYQATFIGNNQNIDQANAQLPGLKAWLLG